MGPQGHRALRPAAAAAVAIVVITACGSSTNTGVTSKQPPTAAIKPPQSVTPTGEGALNLVDWGGYVTTLWQKPFQDATGCKIHVQDAGSSGEMLSLMANGGGGNWDMVSASGDIGLQLIYDGDVKPMNMDLIPDWKNFAAPFKSPAFNTINSIHYGVSLQWGPNTLLYSSDKFPTAPTTWGVLYDRQYNGLVTVPDNPIQIADAALYLSVHDPSLKITDPYELTQKQFNAVVSLLKQQKPLVKKYWTGVSDEETLFKNGDVVAGAAWPLMTSDLKLAGAHTADTIPSEGATGWADSWMLATNAPHPNCAYRWAAWISTAKVQAEQAINYGETPVNSMACAEMEALSPGSCAAFHANAPEAYFKNIKFWKTPMTMCDDGTNSCVPYSQWQTAWTAMKG